MNCTIQGIGLISPWGNNFDTFKANYALMQPVFSEIDRFDVSNLLLTKAALVRNFEPKDYIEAKNVRKYDIFSKFGISASRIALNSMNSYPNDERLTEMGIVVACETQSMVTAAYLDGLVREGVDQVSPKLFSVAAANSANCNIAIETGIKGPSVNVSAKYASGFLAAYTGAQMLAVEQVSDCLVGAVDYLSQIVMEAHSRMGCYKTALASKTGFVPGEGTAVLVLGAQSTKADSGKIYGNILGFGYVCSQAQNYKWPSDIKTQVSALKKAIGAHSVDVYQSMSNGDSVVDDVDETAYKEVFGELPSKPRVVRLKHFLGEFSALPLFQIIAACCEPKGTKTLIAVSSPGGVHGAILVESSGLDEKNDGERNAKI